MLCQLTVRGPQSEYNFSDSPLASERPLWLISLILRLKRTCCISPVSDTMIGAPTQPNQYMLRKWRTKSSLAQSQNGSDVNGPLNSGQFYWQNVFQNLPFFLLNFIFKFWIDIRQIRLQTCDNIGVKPFLKSHLILKLCFPKKSTWNK